MQATYRTRVTEAVVEGTEEEIEIEEIGEMIDTQRNRISGSLRIK
jgi:hypothetical protein